MWENAVNELNDIHPWLVSGLGLLALGFAAWLADLVAKHQLARTAAALAARSTATWDDIMARHGVFKRAAHLLPALLIYAGAPLVPQLADPLVEALRNVAIAYAAIMGVLAVSAALTAANAIYEQRPDSHEKPIKGYIQLAQIALFALGAIVVIAALLDKSPLILLSGFGALTAVLLLVFKDTILSLVASVQLSSLDMVRVGDWIEMPQYNADGDVIDVELHTIRVQNWDKTITTIPTHKLISDSFRNWRGMSESGGRRIKRAIHIDVASVRFLTREEVAHFRRFALIKDYIDDKESELRAYNEGLTVPTEDDVNLRRLTNVGTLRAYIYRYLKHHPKVHKDMTLLVRQLASSATGLPIEIYCFTNTTAWNEYEGIQADIFDHLFAILPEFGLRAFQQPSGADINRLTLSGDDRQAP